MAARCNRVVSSAKRHDRLHAGNANIKRARFIAEVDHWYSISGSISGTRSRHHGSNNNE